MDLDGRTVLVTGGAQGIGKGLARAALKRGARVVIVNLDEQVAAATVAELSALGPIRARRCDVADATDVDALFQNLWDNEGAVDLVFCNAGYGGSAPLLEMPMADVQRMMAVNYYSMLHITRSYAARAVPAGHPGHIMFTGSENSLVKPFYIDEMAMGLYGATKHAMSITAEWLRDELADKGIGVSLLLPGPVRTERLQALFDSLDADPAGGGDRALSPVAGDALREHVISPDECAERAFQGLDAGLFYVPTQGYIKQDVERRHREILDAFAAMGF